MYTRAGCHLCEGVADQLRRAGPYAFRLEVIDVDGDPALRDRYGDWVPVVAVNGKVRFRGAVNPVLLDRLLRAEMSGRQFFPEF
jgi:hypothetical protein